MEDLERLVKDTFKDRRHTLRYQGSICTASQIWEQEGFTLGQRNSRISTHGDSVTALQEEGIIFDIIKPREKVYLPFEDAVKFLRNKVRDAFENHLLFKITEQLKES